MKTQNVLALNSMSRTDISQSKPVEPVSKWNWTPRIQNPEKVNGMFASGGNTTTKTTNSPPVLEHGENY